MISLTSGSATISSSFTSMRASWCLDVKMYTMQLWRSLLSYVLHVHNHRSSLIMHHACTLISWNGSSTLISLVFQQKYTKVIFKWIRLSLREFSKKARNNSESLRSLKEKKRALTASKIYMVWWITKSMARVTYPFRNVQQLYHRRCIDFHLSFTFTGTHDGNSNCNDFNILVVVQKTCHYSKLKLTLQSIGSLKNFAGTDGNHAGIMNHSLSGGMMSLPGLTTT